MDQPPVTPGRPPALLPLPGGVSLRRRRVADSPALCAAVLESLDHLRPWMAWAAEPPVPERTEEQSRAAEAAWESGTEFVYLLGLDAVPGSVIGGCGLHGRIGPGALEIGYWVHPSHTGRGHARNLAAALTEAALALPGIGRVEIHCDEANTASAAVPRRLGYRLDRIEDDGITAPAESGRGMVWTFPPR
ncbi:GNAT family N-acetyltransferase [Peterkaempfera griseoplana]|uniref:GNAT family N-acetyltransferase n=1 Tax=Peterkaempfera griseoplana TaxID=66896 RepID=UPI0007C6BE22|nr:GNAT family protein [Peterkaempfera griseoplana]